MDEKDILKHSISTYGSQIEEEKEVISMLENQINKYKLDINKKFKKRSKLNHNFIFLSNTTYLYSLLCSYTKFKINDEEIKLGKDNLYFLKGKEKSDISRMISRFDTYENYIGCYKKMFEDKRKERKLKENKSW